MEGRKKGQRRWGGEEDFPSSILATTPLVTTYTKQLKLID